MVCSTFMASNCSCVSLIIDSSKDCSGYCRIIGAFQHPEKKTLWSEAFCLHAPYTKGIPGKQLDSGSTSMERIFPQLSSYSPFILSQPTINGLMCRVRISSLSFTHVSATDLLDNLGQVYPKQNIISLTKVTEALSKAIYVFKEL